jgi:hypothetical protein
LIRFNKRLYRRRISFLGFSSSQEGGLKVSVAQQDYLKPMTLWKFILQFEMMSDNGTQLIEQPEIATG